MNERFHNEKVFELFALCALYMANPIQFDPNCNGRAHTPAMLKLMPGLGKWVCLCVAIAFNAILLAYAINWCMCEIGMRTPVFNAFFFIIILDFFHCFVFKKTRRNVMIMCTFPCSHKSHHTNECRQASKLWKLMICFGFTMMARNVNGCNHQFCKQCTLHLANVMMHLCKVSCAIYP